MSVREKSHNEFVERIMTAKLRTWQADPERPGVEMCYRKGKLVVRRCSPPSTVVELSDTKEADR